MNYFYLVLKRNLLLTLTATSLLLCTFSVISMRQALAIAQKPILIGIDSNGTRIIARADDPIFDTEAVQFSKLFVNKLYNFTPQNFMDNVGFASTFFSITLWEQEEAKFLELMKNVEKEQISMKTNIDKITKNSDSEYTILMNNNEVTRLNSNIRNLSLKLYIRRIERNKTNPYGLEVIRYEENILN